MNDDYYRHKLAPMLSLINRQISRFKSRLRGFPNTDALTEAGCKIGKGSYLGKDVLVDPGFAWLITIGEQTVIAPRTVVVAHDASTRKLIGYTKMAPVSIGSYVYIGVGAIILPGTTIGDRCIIGAGAVVRGEIPEGTVVAGNPGEVIAKTDEYLARQQVHLDAWMHEVDLRNVDRAELHPSHAQHFAQGPLRDYMESGNWGYTK